jgi:hypothetical protein
MVLLSLHASCRCHSTQVKVARVHKIEQIGILLLFTRAFQIQGFFEIEISRFEPSKSRDFEI